MRLNRPSRPGAMLAVQRTRYSRTEEGVRSRKSKAGGLVQLHHEMEVGYSRLVTISTDKKPLGNEVNMIVFTLMARPTGGCFGSKIKRRCPLDAAIYIGCAAWERSA